MKLPPKLKKLAQWPMIAVVVIVLAIVVVITSVVIARQIYHSNLKPLNSLDQKSITIEISQGSTLDEVAELLKNKKIIKSDWAFKQYVRDKNASNELKAGTYELSPAQSVSEIVAIITGGKIASNLITILPGHRLDQLKKMFMNNGFSEAEVDKALNPDLYKNHPALVDKPAEASLEGYLYPESFQKTSETKPEDIIRQSLDEMQKRLTPRKRQDFVAQGLTAHQAIILASIVEREADRQADRDQIAQVFLNRLRTGMRLESDATGVYGEPYNTYAHDGLPPGPISNVSESSLNAVAHPAGTSYLYFVAGDDGKVYFSYTKEEHESLVREHCKKLCAPH